MRKRYSLFAVATLTAATLAACAPKLATVPITLAPAGIDWRSTAVFAVSMSDFEFNPAHPIFHVGQPVRLVVTNAGTGEHDFSAPAFFATATYRSGTTLPTGGKIALGAGEKAQIDLIPGVAGDYPLECTVFLHAMFGMTGQITVTKPSALAP